jgi:Protein of unknown function (DUF2442)
MKYPRILSVRAVDDHILVVEFDNCQKRRYDITHLLGKEMFSPLRNPPLFKNVQVEEGGYAIYWNEDIDISDSTVKSFHLHLPQVVGVHRHADEIGDCAAVREEFLDRVALRRVFVDGEVPSFELATIT